MVLLVKRNAHIYAFTRILKDEHTRGVETRRNHNQLQLSCVTPPLAQRGGNFWSCHAWKCQEAVEQNHHDHVCILAQYWFSHLQSPSAFDIQPVVMLPDDSPVQVCSNCMACC